MIGGKIVEIIRQPQNTYVRIVDNKDEQWRKITTNQKTKAMSVGDKLWWQCHKGYWSCSRAPGCWDIHIGPCFGTERPSQTDKELK